VAKITSKSFNKCKLLESQIRRKRVTTASSLLKLALENTFQTKLRGHGLSKVSGLENAYIAAAGYM